MWDKEKVLSLRAHHGLCMAYFVGEGYSSGFKKHMAEVLQAVQPETPVRLAAGVDEICSACPHNCGGVCESSTVDSHDRAVLQACGLQKDQQLQFGEFTSLVQEKIIAKGLREEICGDCQWSSICAATPSRWAKAHS